MRVKVRCPQTFGHIVFLYISSPVPKSFMAGPKSPCHLITVNVLRCDLKSLTRVRLGGAGVLHLRMNGH